MKEEESPTHTLGNKTKTASNIYAQTKEVSFFLGGD